MKVCLVYDSFLPNIGGIEVVMYHIGKELLKRGNSVTVLTRNVVQSKPADLEPLENIDGIIVKRYNNIFSFRFVSDLVNSDFDVIHVFSYQFAVNLTNIASFLSKLVNKPLVVTPIYNPIRPTFKRTFFSKFAAIVFDQKIGIEILKRASLVTALTASEAEFYRKNGVTRVRVVPEGVYISKVSFDEVSKFKEKYDLTDQVVLSIGRLEAYKGHDLLLRAFASVVKMLPNSKLMVVGKDWGALLKLKKIAYEEKCESNIIFTGLLSDDEVACAYEAADVIVHPSKFETFVRTALEAWSHKKPIICFNLGGPTEFIHSNMGILVKYGDISELGEMILKLLENKELSKIMGLKGFQAVRRTHLWKNVVDEYECVYKMAILDTSNSQKTKKKGFH
jgi:glycosyltransferase involved in cell wall biosynthesis